MKCFDLKCEICAKGPKENVTLFRINEKGVPGIWRCVKHLNSIKPDKEVVKIVNTIQGG